MRVTVLGSGSRGNAIALVRDDATLLVDAGFGVRALKQRSRMAGVSLAGLVGIVVTHEHGDHARGVPGTARRHGCPVFGSLGTLRALGARLTDVPTQTLGDTAKVNIGPFRVRVCRTDHDAAEPVCVTVEGLGSPVKVGVAYDLGRATAGVLRLLRGCTCLIVEANHDDQLLRVGPYPPSVRSRIASAGGHLSNAATGRLLAELLHPGLSTIVLAHLSDQCNDPEVAVRTVRRALGARRFHGRLLVAKQDTPLAVHDGVVTQLGLAL